MYAERFEPSSHALLTAVAALAGFQRQAIDTAAHEIAQWSAMVRTALIIFSISALIMGGMLSLWLVRSIAHPIRLAGDTADRVAQQNSALVEQSACASESLRHQAHELAGLISRFLLPEPLRGASPAELAPVHAPQLAWRA